MTLTDAAHGLEARHVWEPPTALRAADPELADLLSAEAERRANSLQLLAGRTSPPRPSAPHWPAR